MNLMYIIGFIAVFGVLILCFSGIMNQPELTALSLNQTNPIIDANQTIYTLHGSTDVNATGYIDSSNLNLSKVYLTVDSNGKLSYDLEIPQNVTDCYIKIYASAKNKLNNSDSLHIERPSTKLDLDSVNMTENDTSLLISGVTEPNLNVRMSFSNSLDLANVSLVADGDGKFKHSIKVPFDKDNFWYSSLTCLIFRYKLRGKSSIWSLK
ncbi:MAG: hypothetical protein LBT10_02250 [Methanobrevibacter sp.]|jgi:hypothetical protein|nr:hypothetical protein [Methanobrevibacter sp.]